MSKEHKLSAAATANDLDKAFASAGKALAILGIKMPMKKPDAEKLEPVMARTGKKAEFKLIAKNSVLLVVVDIGGATTQLGEFDPAKEKDLDDRKKIVESMVEAGLADRSELDQFKEAPDPKMAANRIAKELAGLSKEASDLLAKVTPARVTLQQLRNARTECTKLKYADFKANPARMKVLVAQARKEHMDDSLDFLAAVAGRMERAKLIDTFVREGAEKWINLPAQLTAAIQSADQQVSAKGIVAAAREIEFNMFELDLVPRVVNVEVVAYGNSIAALEAKLAPLETRLQELGQRIKALRDQKTKLAA